MVFLLPNPWGPALIAVGLLGVAAVAGFPGRVAKLAAVLTVPFLVAVVLVQGLFYPGNETPLVEVGPVTFWEEGVSYGLLVFFRVLVVVCAVLIMVFSNEGCVCIVGQNGAGKTTFAKHLNGLLRPTRGRVLVLGKDTREYRVAELAREVGLAFQNPDDQLFRSTVEEEVRFGPDNVGASPEEAKHLVATAMDLMSLELVREKKPHDLGVPERKRVATASVIAMNTPVVVLDEPTGGQDAEGIELLGQLVGTLVQQGKLVIVVTHDVKFAAQHADRVIALHQGRVLLDNDPRTVFGREEALARTHVEPPAVTRLGKRLRLDETLLTPQELLAVFDPE
jgi:energy-coupling factor transporter ATP-binding protein EcfA2